MVAAGEMDPPPRTLWHKDLHRVVTRLLRFLAVTQAGDTGELRLARPNLPPRAAAATDQVDLPGLFHLTQDLPEKRYTGRRSLGGQFRKCERAYLCQNRLAHQLGLCGSCS